SCRQCQKSRHYRHEGYRPGISPRQRRRQSRHRFSAALFHELTRTTAVVGMPTLAMLEQNTTITRNFSPLTKDEMDRLRQQLTLSRDGLEHRLSGHLDGPTAVPELFCV